MEPETRQFWRNLLVGMAVGVVLLAITVAMFKWSLWLVSLLIVGIGAAAWLKL